MKRIYFLFVFSLFLTACGEVEVAEDIPPVVDNVEVDDLDIENTNSADDDLDLIIDCTPQDLKESEDKTVACISDLQAANLRITNLEDTIVKLQERMNVSSQTGKFNDFFVDYLKLVPQDEYAFNSCGRVSSFANAPWFADFQAALNAKSILFKLDNRPLESGDFFGGCVSTAGNMVFLLGAGYNNQTEFHLVKYKLNTKELEEVILSSGNCSDCPLDFGKRKGPFVELLGGSSTAYRYYYEKNILVEDSYFQ